MISDKEVWTYAGTMIQQWGNTADFEAYRRAAELFDVSNLEGQRVWHRIIEAINALQTTQPGETRN